MSCPKHNVWIVLDDSVVNEDWGAEFQFKFFATDALGIQGNYTWFAVDKDIPGDASFPANKVRIGLNCDPKKKFDASINYQWDDGFKSNTPTFPGTIPTKSPVDVSLGFKLSDPLRFEVAAINLLNNRLRALPGYPRLGRTVIGRLVLNLK